MKTKSKRRRSASDTPALDALVAPLSARTFVESFWHRKPVFIRGTRKKFRTLFDEKRFFASAMGALDVRARFGGDAAEEVAIVGKHAPLYYRAGATICVTGVERADPRLAAFINRLTGELHDIGTIDFRAYLSPDGRGYETHYDARIAMTLQIEGEKRWWYSKTPAVPFPKTGSLRVSGRLGEPPPREEMEEVLLRPGDVLCLPAGTWHRASAVGHSLALNLATDHRWGFLDLVFGALGSKLGADAFWREPPPAVLAAEGDDGRLPKAITDYHAAKLEALRAALARVTPDDLHLSQLWRRRVRLSSKTSRLEPKPRPVRVGPGDQLVLAPGPFVFGLGPGPDGAPLIFVHTDDVGGEIGLPRSALPFLRELARRRRLVAREAMSFGRRGAPRSWDEVKPLLELLVARHLLVPE